jgi:hypothetical protein
MLALAAPPPPDRAAPRPAPNARYLRPVRDYALAQRAPEIDHDA